MSGWIDHPSIKAVLWAGLQGQEVGEALAEVLWGEVNPSGRLPYTIARREEDYGARVERDTDGWEVPQTEYTEGLFVDYRWFDAKVSLTHRSASRMVPSRVLSDPSDLRSLS